MTAQTTASLPNQRFVSLRTRMALIFSLTAAIILAVAMLALFLSARTALREEFANRAKGLVNVAAVEMDGDLHSRLKLPQDAKSENFQKLNNTYKKFVGADPDIYSIWSGRPDSRGRITFVLDTREEVQIGEIYSDATTFLKENVIQLKSTIVEPSYYGDQYGYFLTAYTPIYRSDGVSDGFLAVDLYANALVQKETNLGITAITLFGVALPIVVIIGWIFGSTLTAPLLQLAQKARIIQGGDFSARAEVRTNDEIGNLSSTFNAMAAQVSDLIANLENKVGERTAVLEKQAREMEMASGQLERRAAQLQAISRVARAIASINDLPVLLPNISRVIAEQFGYYHVGIFLVDDNKEYAVLRASNSEGGRRMLAREHKLKIGETGIVGTVAEKGRARIALDTGEDAVFFNNPELPNTHSEMALPLRYRDEVIGVLDVQSEEPGAFLDEDIETLSVLADQVAIAIQNSRSFEATRKSLADAENIYRQYIRQEWRELVTKQDISGFRYTSYDLQPLQEKARTAETSTVTTANQLSVPVQLRGETIAVIKVRSDKKGEWDPDEIDIAEAIAERIAIAVENVRLLQDSQRRATKERLIGDISAKISGTAGIDNILQTALKNLGTAIPGANISIQFNPGMDEEIHE